MTSSSRAVAFLITLAGLSEGAIVRGSQIIQPRAAHDAGIVSIAVAPDGTQIATGGNDHTVKLWEARSRRLARTLQGHSGKVSSLAFAPDGKLLASGSFDRSIKLWHMPSGTLRATLAGHPGQVKSVAFSPNGDVLASSSADAARLWDVSSGKLLKLLASERGVLAVAFSPDGSVFAHAGGLGASLWDTRTWKLLRVVECDTKALCLSVAFSPDGRWLATGGTSRAARLWDLHTGQLQHVFARGDDAIRSLAFSNDQRLLIAADRASARSWDLQSRQPRSTVRSDVALLAVALSPGGAIWAGGGADGRLRSWRLGASGSEQRR